jgi:hypothetical protein
MEPSTNLSERSSHVGVNVQEVSAVKASKLGRSRGFERCLVCRGLEDLSTLHALHRDLHFDGFT